MDNHPAQAPVPEAPWWHEVTRYQWMVLAIASAGWVFDVFEGQLFVSVKKDMLESLVTREDGENEDNVRNRREFTFNMCLAAFLAGGALGGVVFGMMGDRWGRKKTMAVTILMYSAFTGLTALVETGWQLAGLRFLVGMGVGGEWAVAAATVAEVFSPRACAGAAGIFHASSVLGTFLAVAVGLVVLPLDNGWRLAFFIGVLPALLVAWIRVSMREPESWQAAQQMAQQHKSQRLGRFTDLFATPQLRKNTLLGMGLAVIGLATFWGTHIRGREFLTSAISVEQSQLPEAERDKGAADRFGLYGMFLVTLGGGAGLLSFAPLSQRVGRRPAFAVFHVGGFMLVVLLCLLPPAPLPVMLVLPFFGFFTLGLHAGYAVYFPELFPTRLRGTGAGFCFNAARIVAGPVLLGFAFLQGPPLDLGLRGAMLVLACLFPVGLVILWFAPETPDSRCRNSSATEQSNA